ncbi:hypothetical protein FF1_027042 [Malus domestica]|uniref:Dehydrin 3 n=1 Tax=Malus prunifolia TaxID=106564 RepID=A0A385MI74_9ROSA|nr:dehydrin 3 [Malus prunifolia]
MSHLHNQHGAQPTDAYGNPIQRTDEYGNPLGGATTGATTGGYGAHDTAAATTGHDYGRKEHHGVTGALHRSGSSSSSSSEDDGLGGRRKKKGLKQKIKEKLPGSTTTDTTYGTAGTTYPGGHQQDKGMMDKIKDKLPGTGHKDDPHYSTTTHASTTTTPYGGATYTEEHHEKKGIMDKIKEKLPGGNQ